jgi:hypothetical protein
LNQPTTLTLFYFVSVTEAAVVAALNEDDDDDHDDEGGIDRTAPEHQHARVERGAKKMVGHICFLIFFTRIVFFFYKIYFFLEK